MSGKQKNKSRAAVGRPVLLTFCVLSAAVAAAPKKHPTVKQFRSTQWTDWQMGGNCTADNTQVIDNGSSVSILLDSFGVQMPEGASGDGLKAKHTCWLKLRVQPPPGRYLDSFRQIYRGGIIKSAGAAARFDVRYQLDEADRQPQPLQWEKGSPIDPASPDSLFSAEYEDDVREKKCGRPMKYGIHLVFTGERPSQNEFVMGGLDSIDADLQRVVELEPVWGNCPPGSKPPHF